MSPLRKSDHSILKFECDVSAVTYSQSTTYNYQKGSYDKLCEYLNVDWDHILCPEENSMEKMWMMFKDRFLAGIDMYIPKTNNGFYKKFCAVHPFNYDFKQMINKKHRLWTRYLETRNPTVPLQYKRKHEI